jgi:hypothetical protein
LINSLLDREKYGSGYLIKVGIIGIFSLGCMFCIYLYSVDQLFFQTYVSIPSRLFKNMVHRLNGAQNINLALILNYIPEHHGYFLGTTLPNPKGIFPFESISLPKFVYTIHPEFIPRTVANYTPPAIAEGYANFGYAGLILFQTMICLQIYFLQIVFCRTRKNPFWLSVYIWIAFEAINFSQGSMFQVYFSPKNILCFIGIFIIYQMAIIIKFSVLVYDQRSV